MRVAVIIVNFRTADLVYDCLQSLHIEKEALSLQVVVVDNDSQDGSVERLSTIIEEHGWQQWVVVLPQEHNRGFAGGNNLALRYILSIGWPVDYFWLLNPDTVIRDGAGQHLVQFLGNNPGAGIVGSRLEDPDSTPQVSAFRYHSIVGEFLSGMRLGYLSKMLHKWVVAQRPVAEKPHVTDWLAGASMMVRKEVFEQVGFFDDHYFLYFEEEDFCKQAADAGWQSWYVPASRVVHLVGMASGFSDHRKKAPRRPTYWFESRRRFFLKNYGKIPLFCADVAWMVGFCIWRMRRLLQGKPDTDPPFFLQDFFSHSVFCKGFRL